MSKRIVQYHVPYYYYHVLPWRLIITASLQHVPHSLLVIFSFLFLLFVNTSAYRKCNFTVEKINKSCCHVSGSQRNTSYEFLSISLKFTQDVQIPSSRERQFETICLHAASILVCCCQYPLFDLLAIHRTNLYFYFNL